MIEPDTIKLLRECDAGIKMGISSLEEVIDHVQSSEFRRLLVNCKDEHEHLQDEAQKLLAQYQDEGKEPSPMAKGMSWMKTNMKMAMADSDKTIAGLITDGCNMGVKSLNKYLNQYKAADEKSKKIAKSLTTLEEQLVTNIKAYL